MSSSGKQPKSSIGLFTLKIWTVHIIAMVIYLFVLVLTAQLMGDTPSVIIATILSTAVYIACIYVDAWRTGQRDYNLVKYGHIKEDKLKGLKASIISQIPGLILAAVLIFYTKGDFFGQAYRWIYLFFCYVVNLLAEGTKAAYFIPLVFAPVTASIAYRLGYKGTRLFDKIVFVNDKNYENLR